MNSPHKIHRKLEKAIDWVVVNKERFVEDPDTDFIRNRKLPMRDLVKTLLSMEGGSLNKELYKLTLCSSVSVTPSAFAQQRNKLRPEGFKALLDQFNERCDSRRTFRGYKVYAVDGSDISIYRNPSSESFICPSTYPEGYNLLHLNALYDLFDRTYTDCIVEAKSKCDERMALCKILARNQFDRPSIIIVDRGYEAYNMFAHFLNTPNVDFVCRIQNGGLRPVRALPMRETDETIVFEVTTSQTNEDKAHNRAFIQTGSKHGKVNSSKTHISHWDFSSPYRFELRVVRVQLDDGKIETLITSLPRNKFSQEDIKQLYHMRWGIETSFRELKYTIGLSFLHSKKEKFAYQEIYAAIVMYNFCERIAACAVIKKKDGRHHAYQLNYSMAVTICKGYFRRSQSFISITTELERYILPIRKGRSAIRKLNPHGFVSFLYRVSA